MGVNQQRHFGVEFPKRGVGGERHLHEIPNAAHIHKHLVGSLIGKASAKLANHRSPVLPPYLRLSTRHRDRRDRNSPSFDDYLHVQSVNTPTKKHGIVITRAYSKISCITYNDD